MRPGRFNPPENPRHYWVWDWVGPRAILDLLEKEKNILTLLGIFNFFVLFLRPFLSAVTVRSVACVLAVGVSAEAVVTSGLTSGSFEYSTWIPVIVFGLWEKYSCCFSNNFPLSFRADSAVGTMSSIHLMPRSRF